MVGAMSVAGRPVRSGLQLVGLGPGACSAILRVALKNRCFLRQSGSDHEEGNPGAGAHGWMGKTLPAKATSIYAYRPKTVGT